jgi:plasmid stabilization system protein ParE
MILQDFPLLGSAVPRKRGVRKLLSFPYVIYYRTREKQAAIDILRYLARPAPNARFPLGGF